MNKKVGIILFHYGVFGGATKRFSNLFHFLYQKYPDKFYFIVNFEFYEQIKVILPEIICENVFVIGISAKRNLKFWIAAKKIFKKQFGNIPEITNYTFTGGLKEEQQFTPLQKNYLHLKNYYKQYLLFKEIDQIRRGNSIDVFLGVYSGILPLYFYLKKKKRPTIIFSDMDSWFSNLNDTEGNYWYKKYDSFNYGLENSDKIDFLSPFIVDGILKRNIKLNKGSISIAPCSFSDYSKCIPGDKKDFLVSYAARIFPDKNPMLYLEAANIIIKKYPFVKFNLLGEGLAYLHREINDFIELNKLRDNLFLGFHPNPPEVFSISSVFVSIQTTNNYPSQSVLEAMACENAIIASDVGDTRTFINEKVGILIPLDLNSLVNALELLINDKEHALRLGKNAREFVLKNHTIEKCADYYLDLFEQTQVETDPEI